MLVQRYSVAMQRVGPALFRSSWQRGRQLPPLKTTAAVGSLCLLLISLFVFIPSTHTYAQASYPKPALGVNVGTDAQLFTDAMKTTRPTWDASAGGDCPLDANGWPTKDCGVYVWEAQAHNDGTYHLVFNGQATVDVSLGYATVSNQQYDAASNTTTATLVVTDTGAENFHLNFTNTKRDASSDTNTGVTNVRLYKPTSEGSSTPFDAAQIFTPWFKQAVAPYNYLRFMAGTNWNKSTHWSDRTRVGYATQRFTLPGDSNFEGNLMAFEYMVELCNETGKDMYVNIPDRADDDYVTKLAQLIRYGSDGVNPYTSPQSNPTWKPLDSKLNVYVEYTNEAWNFSFDQAHDISDAANAEVQNNPASPLSYDQNTNTDVIRFRYYARRSLQISTLFRQVFGDSDMLTRVRPVLEWQYSNLNGTAEQSLEFLNNYYNNADGTQHVSDPHPVSYFFWGGGGAVYYNSNNDSADSIDGIYNSGIPSDGYQGMLNVESLWAHLYGLHFMAYEGGFAVGGDGPSAVGGQSRWDPRAKQSMIDSFNDFAAAGGDAYTVGTYAQWNDILQANSAPLVQAAATITSSDFTPAPINRGQVVSGSDATIIEGPHYDVARNWPQGPGSNLGKDTDYLLRVESAGTYQVAVNAGNTQAGGKINVYLDGTLLKTIDVPTSAQSIVVGSASLSAGLHGVILRPAANAGNGSAGTIYAVVVQPGSGTPPNLPTPGALPTGWQSADIGGVGQAGSASYDNGTFRVISSGGDIANTTDQFHYVYQSVSGDGSIVARVSFESGANDYAKAGVMIRETLDGGSTHASTFLFAGNGAVLNDRTTTGGNSQQAGPIDGFTPYWVKIERSGSTFTSSVSADGSHWKQVGTATITMGKDIKVGLAYSSHDNAVLAAADFDQVSVNGFGTSSNPTPTPTPGTPTPTPGTSTYLSDLNWSSATAGYGSVQKDKSSSGNTLTLQGTTYPKGIGTHAVSEIHYALNGSYKTFVSDVGVDDESWTGGSVVFQVFADGQKVFDSGVMHASDTVQHVSIDVSGVKDLELYAGDAGDGINNDHADWAGAKLLQ